MVRRRIARAAVIIMLGTLTTSLLGFVRAFVVARYFGAGVSTDAFFAALVVPQMFYDQLIGGAITAAFIPTFTRLYEQDREELWRVVGSVFALLVVLLVSVILVLEVAAPLLMRAIASGFGQPCHAHAAHHGTVGACTKAATLNLSVKLVRYLLPALLFMGLSAVAVALLYSLNRRMVPSFATSFYHLGIVGAAVGFASRGVVALPVGAVAGAALQFGVQIPSMLRAEGAVKGRFRLWMTRLRPDFQNPAVRRIIRLYLPVAAGMCVSIAGQIADVNFKSHLPRSGDFSAMQYATQLVQFPIGIVVAGLGFAVLPAISSDAASERLHQFKETLSLGFRLVMLMLIPAAVGLLVLATPVVALLFQRGHFHHADTIHTATALLGYSPQLPLVGIDQLLIFAFYARHNTVTPALVGVVGVLVYVAAAALLLGPLSIFGLALANTIQIGSHALLLFALLLRAVGPLPWERLLSTAGKVAFSSTVMGFAIVGSERWLVPAGVGIYSRLLAVGIPVLMALMVYAALLALLRVEEAASAWAMVRARFMGGSLH